MLQVHVTRFHTSSNLHYGFFKCIIFFQRRSLRSPRKMDRLRRSFRDSFRRRKDRVPESSKPHQWQADESAVRSGTCTFSVKYLGCVEVFESRGMQVCEEALKVLRVRCLFDIWLASKKVLVLLFTYVRNNWQHARSVYWSVVR